MQLYNTLSKQKEAFAPLTPGRVKLYTCGPTVYNFYHIGNLRNAIFNDTLRRCLDIEGYTVQHVMNITDVGHLVSDADEGEDKLENGAAREGKTVWEVAEFYTKAFKEDMLALNILPPNIHPNKPSNRIYTDTYARATDFIVEQVEMIQLLLQKDFAYQTKQAIYFEVAKLSEYGLSGQKLSEKNVAVREEIVSDPEKRSPHDFALWFFTVGHYAHHSMKWDAHWGVGFPGWHLECSAIIHATLGDPIDIHTGGIDHIGTHHPNEIAQTQGAYGHALSRFWIHNEFILVNGEKMSKSKGNAYLLKDIIDHGFSPMDLRLLYLSAHYRSQMNFTWEALAQARKNKETIFGIVERLQDYKNQQNPDDTRGSEIDNEITEAIQDDLNTPKVLALVLDHCRQLNQALDTHALLDASRHVSFFKQVYEYFGLKDEAIEIPEAVQKLLNERSQARANKNFQRSDELRDEFLKLGYIVEDTPAGQRVRRK